MSDYDELAVQYQAEPADGRDPLEAAGLTALPERCDLGDLKVALQRLRMLTNGTDPLDRIELEKRAVALLKERKIDAPGRWVTAAIGKGNGAGGGVDTPAQGQVLAFDDPDPWPDPVDGALLLEQLRAFVRRFVRLPPGADDVLAAYVLVTHAIDAFGTTPYLVLESPTPECGKTRVLEVLALLVRRPWFTLMPSTAVLFRVLEQHHPTMLLDECQAVRGRGEAADNVRDLLLAGYKLGGTVPRCVGDQNEVRHFGVFGPKVFALIGELPGPLASRCIRIGMQRRRRNESVERFRPRWLGPEALALARQGRRWADDHREALKQAEPAIPVFIQDRLEEIWEPLLAVGQVAGGDWGGRLVAAARQLTGNREADDVLITLLADIHRVFTDRDVDRLSSAALVETLVAIEGRPWADWRGKPLSANALARLLKPLKVAPKKVKIDGESVNGYKRHWFTDAWERYLPASQLEHPEPSSDDAAHHVSGNRNPVRQGSSCDSAENPRHAYEVPAVPVGMQGKRGLDTVSFEAEQAAPPILNGTP